MTYSEELGHLVGLAPGEGIARAGFLRLVHPDEVLMDDSDRQVVESVLGVARQFAIKTSPRASKREQIIDDPRL